MGDAMRCEQIVHITIPRARRNLKLEVPSMTQEARDDIIEFCGELRIDDGTPWGYKVGKAADDWSACRQDEVFNPTVIDAGIHPAIKNVQVVVEVDILCPQRNVGEGGLSPCLADEENGPGRYLIVFDQLKEAAQKLRGEGT